MSDQQPAITVRPLEGMHGTEWLELWRGYFTSANSVASEEVARLTWARLMDEREPMHALGAFEGDQLVGFAHVVFHRSTHVVRSTCYLEDLYVDDRARRRGVGRMLIDAVVELARASADRMYWITNGNNQAAQRLYEGLTTPSGFIHYSLKLGQG